MSIINRSKTLINCVTWLTVGKYEGSRNSVVQTLISAKHGFFDSGIEEKSLENNK